MWSSHYSTAIQMEKNNCTLPSARCLIRDKLRISGSGRIIIRRCQRAANTQTPPMSLQDQYPARKLFFIPVCVWLAGPHGFSRSPRGKGLGYEKAGCLYRPCVYAIGNGGQGTLHHHNPFALCKRAFSTHYKSTHLSCPLCVLPHPTPAH